MYTYEILQREDFFLFGLHEDAYHYFLLVQIIQMLETIIFINFYYNWATFMLLIHIFYCGVMSLCLLLLTIN